jgi:hypothetical protein
MMVLRILFGLLLISSVSAGTPYLIFKENGKSGLKTEQGKILIPAQYDAIGWSNGTFSLMGNVTGFKNGTHWGLIDIDNRKITKGEYTDLYPADGAIIIAAKLTKSLTRPSVGCITPSGKQVIPFMYDGISISALRAIVFTQIGNQFRYGLVDMENKTLIPQQYQEIRSLGTLRFAVRNFEGKIAVFSDIGQRITGFEIDSLSNFNNDHDLATIYQGKFQGLINRAGEIVVEPKFRDISVSPDREVKVREADEWLVLTSKHEIKHRLLADSVIAVGKNLFKISTAGQTQLVDRNFSPVGNANLTDIHLFDHRNAVYQLGSLFGVMQSDGKVVIPALYKQIVLTQDFILAREKNGNAYSWILFDSAGTRKINRAYEAIRYLDKGYFEVKHRGFFGLINESGKEVVACAYDSIIDLKQNNLIVKFKGLYGVITVNEEWVISPRANKITLISRDRFIEHSQGTSFLKERNGNVIYFSSNPIVIFDDHLLEYLPSGTIWKIDMAGVIVDRQVNPAEATEEIYEVSEGYRAIRRNGRYGFIDSRGRLRIANRYEGVQPFSEGHAAVKILGKWGFINVHDNIAVQPVYEEVWPFQNGFALVKQKGMKGLIDKKGNLVLPVRYDNIEILPTGNMLLGYSGMAGLADRAGKILIQPTYDFLHDVGAGFAIVSKNRKYGVVGYNGVSTIPLMYDMVTYDPGTAFFLAERNANWQTVMVR